MSDNIRVEITGSSADLRHAVTLAESSIRDLGREVRKQNAEQKAFAQGSDDQTRALGRLEKQAKRSRSSLFNLSKTAKLTAAGFAALGPAASLIDATIAGTVGLGSALTPVVGLAASGAQGLAAFGQAAGTVKLATDGVSEALKGNQKAFQKLTPEAKHFVETLLRYYKPALEDIRKSAQQGLFGGVDKGLQQAKANLPVVKQIVTETSNELGKLAAQAGKIAGSKRFGADLGSIGHANVHLIDDAGQSAFHLASALDNVVVAAEPLTKWLADSVTKWTAQIDAWSTAARKSGELTKFFNETKIVVGELAHDGSDLAHILVQIGKAAAPLGQAELHGLTDLLDHLRAWSESAQGKAQLATFFRDAQAPLEAVAHLAGDLVKDILKLGEAAAPSLTQLAQILDHDVLPTVDRLATFIAKDVLPHLLPVVKAGVDAIKAAEPGVEAAYHALSPLLDEVGSVLHILAKIEGVLPGVLKLGLPLAAFFGGKAIWGALLGNIRAVGAAWKGVQVQAEAATVAEREAAAVGVVGGVPVVGPRGEVRSPGGVILPAGRTAREVAAGGAPAGAGRGGLRGVLGNLRGSIGRTAGPAALIGIPIITTLAGSALGGRSGQTISAVGQGALLGSIGGAPGALAGGLGGLALDSATHTKGFGAGGGAFGAFGGFGAKSGSGGFDKQGLTFVNRAITDLVKGNNIAGLRQLAVEMKTFTNNAKQNRAAAAEVNAIADALSGLGGNLNKLVPGFSKTVGGFKTNFDLALKWATNAMDGINLAVGKNMAAIRQTLGTQSLAGKQAVAINFAEAAQAIEIAMQRGQISTAKGLAAINKMFDQALGAFGISAKDAKGAGVHLMNPSQFAHAIQPTGAGQPGLVSNINRNNQARGGLIQLGKPGEAGRDSIPMNLGGMNVVAAPGEAIAVINRHQMQELNARTADVGGLPGFFSTYDKPNYMAQGGFVPMASGGIAAMIAEANKVDSHHYPYRWGGGHDAGFTPPYDCSGAVSDILHAAGLLKAPMVAADFMHFGKPGPGAVTFYSNPGHVYMSIDGKFFGTSQSNPGGGAGFFPGGARPGFTVTHLDAGAGFGDIKAPKVGGSGAITAIVQAGLNMEAKAANHKLAGVIASFGGVGGGDMGDSGGAAQPHGSWDKLVRQVGLPTIFDWIIDAESSGNPRADNGIARGLTQINYRSHPDLAKRFDLFDPLQNLEAALTLYRTNGLQPWDASRHAWGQHLSSGSGSVRAVPAHARGALIEAANGLLVDKVTGHLYGPGSPGHPVKGHKGHKPPKPPGTSYHWNPYTGRYEPMTAAQYKALQRRWYAQHPGTHIPTGPAHGHKPKKPKPKKHKTPHRHQSKGSKLSHFGLPPGVLSQARKFDGFEGDFNSLTDSFSGIDSAFSALNAQYLVTPDGQQDQVVNEHGMTVGGKFVPGIDQATKLLSQELENRQRALEDLDRMRNLAIGMMGDVQQEIAKLVAKAAKNAKRIATVKAKIDGYKKKKHHTAADRKALTGLHTELNSLRADQNGLTGQDEPNMADVLRSQRQSATAVSDLAPNATWDGGQLGPLETERNAIGDKLKGFTSATDQFSLKAMLSSIDQIRGEISDATGTVAPTPTANSGLTDLLKQKTDLANANARLAAGEALVLKSFNPAALVGGLGGFAVGTDYVKRTGLALIHEGERITANPGGPYGNQVRPYGNEVMPGGGSRQPIVINLYGDAAAIVQRAVAASRDQTVQIVRQTGRDGRQLAVSPGRFGR